MRAYLEAMRMSYRRYRTYTSATFAGLLTNAFFGVLRSSVFVALYRSQMGAVVDGFSLRDAISYVWLSQGMIAVLSLWSWFEIADSIRSGEIAGELTRPVSYFGFWLARDLGRAGYHVLFRLLPTVTLGALLFGVQRPHALATVPLVAVSLLLAVVISFEVRFILNVSAFWTTDVRGSYGIALVFLNFFSGFLVPLAFFPAWLRSLAQRLPFSGMVSTPLTLYLEQATGSSALWLLGKQALWVLLLMGASRLTLWAALRRLVVQGG